jgi:hypothetical protein
MIHNGGVETVLNGGTADTVTFLGLGATLNLETPLGLKDTIRSWQVGDVIDFLNTNVTSADKTGNKLTVTYDGNKTATYTLVHQEPHTQFQLKSDGHGGTLLTLSLTLSDHQVSVIGIADAGHGHGHGLM